MVKLLSQVLGAGKLHLVQSKLLENLTTAELTGLDGLWRWMKPALVNG